MTQRAGVFCPVLHAHLPYTPLGEGPFSLEETWLFQATAECYLPLLGAFDTLTKEHVPWALTLDVSPTLLALWDDARFFDRGRRFFEALQHLLADEAEVLGGGDLAPALSHHAAILAGTREAFERHGSRLRESFAHYAKAGGLELLASAATHPVLPLIADRPESARAQIIVGIEAFRRAYGGEPRGFWLPECAYTPDVEPFLAAEGIQYAFVESHGVTNADPRPLRGVERPILSPGGVVFFGRDARTARQVWSATEGYPGDPRYREFHADLGLELPPAVRERYGLGSYVGPLGLKLRRVTVKGSTAPKEAYDPHVAAQAVAEHAEDFVAGLVAAAKPAGRKSPPPISVSAYDAELFGHWWFEGPQFLEAVFRRLAVQRTVVTATPPAILAEHPECDVALPSVSSWGRGGYFEVWLSKSAEDIPPRLRDAAERLLWLVRHDRHGAAARRALDQAARELLLAQSSDWPFILAMGTTTELARARFDDHLGTFHQICAGVERGEVDPHLVARREREYPIFSFLDHRVYT